MLEVLGLKLGPVVFLNSAEFKIQKYKRDWVVILCSQYQSLD